jgi:hypothetical protein
MEIRNSASLSNVASTAASPQQIASLKLGAILDVVVQARMGENRFQLQRLPGGEPLTAMSQAELAVGQRLQVQVSRLGTLPELRILPAEPPQPEVVPKALRELLPKQIDLKEFSAMLGRLSLSGSLNLSEPVRLAMERLVAAMPQAEKLITPEGLQKAVRNSGVFLEASLASVLTDGAPLPENDLKARLLNLLAALQEGEGEKASPHPQSLKQESAQLPPGTAPSRTATQAPEEAGGQASPNPDKGQQRPESALPKTTRETLLPQWQNQGAAERQFPAAQFAPGPSAQQPGEKGIGQALVDPEAFASEPEQRTAKNAADKAAHSTDLQKPEKEWLAAGAKSQPLETSPSTARNVLPHSLTGKAEDSFSKREEIDLTKLAQKAEGALAKIAVDQLASQPRDDGTVCLQLNLPFVAGNHQDNAELSITSEGGSPPDDRLNPAWTATIQLQPPGMGAFSARITWNGAQIDACLWSDRQETAERIGQATETLRARLEQAGLAVGALAVLDRPPSSPVAETLDLHLLDLLA